MGKKLLFLFCAMLHLPAFAQNIWTLSDEKEGIRVYTRPVANSKIKAIKVECSLSVKPSQLVYIIMDIDNSKQWVYHGKAARVIKRVSPAELYYYSEVVVPWPCENRDYISHIIVNQNPKTKIVIIDAPCVTGLVPVRDKLVRITHSIGKWTIEPTDNKGVKVAYELEVDPAGSVPAWLINMFATQGPMETFQRLKAYLQKPEVRMMKADFIVD